MKILNRFATYMSCVVLTGLSSVASASPITLTFQHSSGSGYTTLGNQLQVVITDEGNSEVSFRFSNFANGGTIDSAIREIYFSDGLLFGNPLAVPAQYIDSDGDLVLDSKDKVLSGGDVNFIGAPVNPANPPNLNSWSVSQFFSADAQDGNIKGEIDVAGEWAQFTLTLLTGRTWDDVVSALTYDPNKEINLRIALHVGSIDGDYIADNNGNSDSLTFVNNFPGDPAPPSGVPEPASLALLALGSIGLGGFGLRRRKANAA